MDPQQVHLRRGPAGRGRDGARHPPAETCISLADTLLDAALLPGLRDALSAANPRPRATVALATYRRERPWFARNRGGHGASGLYAEEFDIARRQLGGNLPQVFVPALLLEAAARLGE
ncbi:hypothetical protein [Streptomyces pseudovenezuelae]|uniref:Uncharacterized protein n=1 Tax=Streptomyces pseudovenezuelae TaxID=67350 RepID=A0A101N5I1_9ACTN|nr:hypothetical protein AQI94_19590 [Streptomyces pseudovenezuelae]